jgi:hypothetical protein
LTNVEVTDRQYRSQVWLHFKKADDYRSSRRATCMRCNKILLASCGSTTTMHSHLRRFHPSVFIGPAGAGSSDR